MIDQPPSVLKLNRPAKGPGIGARIGVRHNIVIKGAGVYVDPAKSEHPNGATKTRAIDVILIDGYAVPAKQGIADGHRISAVCGKARDLKVNRATTASRAYARKVKDTVVDKHALRHQTLNRVNGRRGRQSPAKTIVIYRAGTGHITVKSTA